MTGRVRSNEHGVALIWTILLMVLVAALVSTFVMVAQRSGERSGDAARRVANAATVQTAVTRVLYGFQNSLGSEQDYYTLDAADLNSIVDSAGGLARVRTVTQLKGLPAEYRSTLGVWEHEIRGGRHVLASTGVRVPSDVVEEPFQADVGACTAAGLPASACQSGGVNAYWQVFRVVMPDITGEDSPSVVLTLRSWLGNPQVGAWSKASYARVEVRPGRFADFQLISDGNMRFGPGALINGPVHSNGFDDGSFSTVHQAPGAAPRSGWVYLDAGVRCQAPASITISTGVIRGPGLGPACNAQGATGQTISFLRAVDSIDSIEASAARGRAGTGMFRAPGRRGNESGRDPYHTAWNVRFNGTTMSVDYPDGGPARTLSLGRVNAFVFDEDVRVRGTVAEDRRVTIAARRDGGASAMIYVDGDIRKGDDRSTSIGLIAQGDVVLWQAPGRACSIGVVQAAMVAATGGVTIPTRYTTGEVQSGAPTCGQRISLDGSIAGHRPPTLVWTWPGGHSAGFTGTRTYTWDEQLKRNPPPFFPLTGTWQPFNIREANVDCLFDPARQADPACR